MKTNSSISDVMLQPEKVNMEEVYVKGSHGRAYKVVLPVYLAWIRLTQMDYLLFRVMESKTADKGSVGSNKCLFVYLGFAYFWFCLHKKRLKKRKVKAFKYG